MGRGHLASVALNVRSAARTSGQWQSAIRPGLRYHRAPAGRGTRVDSERIGGDIFYSPGVTKNRGLLEVIVIYVFVVCGSLIAFLTLLVVLAVLRLFYWMLLLPNEGV